MRAQDDDLAWAEVLPVHGEGVWICLWPDKTLAPPHIEVTAAEALELAAMLVRAAGYDLK